MSAVGHDATSVSLPESTAFDALFARDVFLLRPAPLAASETHVVVDEAGDLLLEAAAPRRLARLAVSVPLIVAAFPSGMLPVLVLSVGAAGLLPARHQFVGFACGLLAAVLAGAAAAVWTFLRLLGRQPFTFHAAGTTQPALLELRPRSCGLGFGTRYEVCDDQGLVLATLRTSHLLNLFRERWQGTAADGRTRFVAVEDSIVPRVVRTSMHNIVAFLYVSAAFLVLTVGAVVLWAFAAAAALGALKPVVLAALAAVYLAWCAAAFFWRRLLPDCSIRDAGDHARLGAFRRQPDPKVANVLDLRDDDRRTLDRRVALALAVLLDRND